MAQNNPVPKIYRAVIEDVIKNVRESFLNEGVDEQVLNELKQLWENKLQQSRAIDVIPTDVNVRVSLTYPHTSQPGSTSTSQQQSTPKQTTQQQSQQSAQPVPATHIIRNPTQQVVYVSNHHPTLGHVGPMTGAAAQAAMALQNPAGRGQPRAIIQQPIVSVGVPGGQVILQTTQGAPSLYQQFPGHLAAVPQRVIYAPATAAAPSTTASQSKEQKPTTRIIQVDGSSDDKEPALAKSKSKFKRKCLDEVIIQVDGPDDSDSDDDDDEDYDNIPVTGIGEVDEAEGEGEEEEPLNSEDDVSDEEHTDLFETDNVVVCQYDKIARTRNRWKFHLKDGIMNLNSKDFVFHKANGDAEW